jgi:C-terminal processing protease CtpA/Prc
MKRILLLLCATSLVFGSCKHSKNDDEDYTTVNECIYDIMDVYYLWNTKMPSKRKVDFDKKPDEFFDGLLYSAIDIWSFCSDNSQVLDNELEGTPYSMGYEPMFVGYNNNKNVLIFVVHVYPNTPAERAGLKRGDIILDINDTPLTPDNYYELYTTESCTYSLGVYNPVANTVDLSGIKKKLNAEKIEADPSIFDTIFYVGNRPVGYYAYMAFTTGDKYIPSMDAVFDRFKAAGVKDLILDLRYNGGGSIETAGHLASAIAPASAVNNHEVLVSFVYNDLLTNYFRDSDEDNYYRFPNNSHNADIQNLYVLGTRGTASASELVTIGLKPYMNVTIVGENTYGKYTGMIVFDKEMEGCEDLENWAIAPIVMKYANSLGFTDFGNGLKPDIQVEDDLLSGYPFGCPDDPMIAAVLDQIGGMPLTAKAARKSPFIYLGGKRSIGNNLIVNGLRDIKR